MPFRTGSEPAFVSNTEGLQEPLVQILLHGQTRDPGSNAMDEMTHISAGRAFPVTRVPRFDIETDVIVVGFGAAGACAAIEAGSAGARVTLFEVASGNGGTSALSGGEI